MSSWLAILRAILRDPFYRYEARRFWTWRRYAWTILAVILFAIAGAGCLAGILWYTRRIRIPGSLGAATATMSGGDFLLLCSLFSVALSRLPLCVVAALGGALSVVPERVSGQLEQFVLTPVDPHRFALARMAGRLKGLFFFWLALGLVLAPALVAVLLRGMPRMPGDNAAPGEDQLAVLQAIMGHFDLGVMLVLDVVVGTYWSARARSTAGAVVGTLLVSCLLLPLILYMPAIIGSIVLLAMTFPRPAIESSYQPLLEFVGAVLHLGLGLVALQLFLRWTFRRMERVFYRPEG